MSWDGHVVAQSSPTFSYPNDIIGRHCRVSVSSYFHKFKVKTQATATDVATSISASHKGTKSHNGAKKWALEALCKKLHCHLAAEKQRLAKEAEIKRLQQQIADEQKRHAQRLREQREAQRQQLKDRKKWLMNQLDQKRAEFNEKHSELMRLEQQINCEEKAIAEFKTERYESDTKVVIVIGHTGDGKSTFINRFGGDKSLFGDEGHCKVSGIGQSCTQKHCKSVVTINGVKYVIVDTPGFNDSFGRDREHSNKLCTYLKGCNGINNFVLIRNSTNVRFDEGFQNMLKQYHKMFGDVFFESLIIVATRVDSEMNRLQFERNNQAKLLQQDIKKKFHLNMYIPIVCIGLEYYKDSIENLVDIISENRFECEDIKSPIDELKGQRVPIRNQDDALRQRVDAIQQEINTVNAAINGL